MFEYHVENGGAVITAADGESEYLIVPKQLDGYPVTAVGERAFYGQKQRKKIALPDTVTAIGSYAFAECRQLQHVTMPKHLTSIGNYAFYNCHALEETALPPHLNTMGYGAYKNCSALKLVRVYADEGQKIAVSALIDDLSNEVALDMYDASGKLLTKLVFTEYEYDCIIQVEARQFDWVYHGSGNIYRECISDSGVDYHKYDGAFHNAVREDWPKTAMRIALGRVLYPYRLSEEYKKVYTDYLIKNKEAVYEMLLKERQLSELEMCAGFLLDGETADRCIRLAREDDAGEFVSFLMDYKLRHFSGAAKQFDL